MRRRTGLGIAAAAATVATLLVRASRGSHPHVEVTYPPLDVPKPLADGVWIVDAGPISARGLPLPVRMTVVRLAGGDLLLHSPTPYGGELARALEALGPVRHLVSPNIAHWMYIADWQRAYPDATVWAVPGLRERGQVRRSGLRIDAELAATPPPAWADEIAQGLVAGGAGFHETWFFHRPSRTLLLTDLVTNLQPRKLPPGERLLMRAAAGTSGVTARYLRPILRLRQAGVREAVRAMIALQPERVVLAHGDIFADRATERLREAFAWLG